MSSLLPPPQALQKVTTTVLSSPLVISVHDHRKRRPTHSHQFGRKRLCERWCSRCQSNSLSALPRESNGGGGARRGPLESRASREGHSSDAKSPTSSPTETDISYPLYFTIANVVLHI